MTWQVEGRPAHRTRRLSAPTAAFQVGADARQTEGVLAARKKLRLNQSVPADRTLQLLVDLLHHVRHFILAPTTTAIITTSKGGTPL